MLDQTDYRIIDILQSDGRITFSQLGKRLGLTRQAVARRINRMLDGGFIRGFSVNVDHSLLGRPTTAYIDILFNSPFTDELQELAVDYISRINGATLANTTIGEKYITVKIRARDLQHVDKIVRAIQDDLPSVSTRTVLANQLFFTNKKISYSHD